MNTKVLTLLKWIAVFFLVVVLFSQIYSGLVNPVTTDTVYTYSSYTGYDTVGFIVRNETVVEDMISGVLSYEIADGGRVAKGGTIATEYSSTLDADNRIRLEKLDRRITTLEKIQTYNDLNATDITSVNRNIHDAITEVINATQNGNVGKSDYYDVLLENMARKQLITGQAADFNTLLTKLKAERDSIKSSIGHTGGMVVSPQSGYVIYTVDGYENVLTVDSMDELNVETLKSVEPTDVPENAVCKIVSDYEWYIAVAVPFDESLNLKQGNKVVLKTALQSTPELSVTVKHINKQSVGEEAVVVFSCDTMNTELAQLRQLDVTVVYKEYEGLKVDNRAIRIVDGKKGVYVYLASQVKFVPVTVIWSGKNYSIVEREASEDTVLRIYDEIIVKGKNLYDGKIIG